MENSQKIKIISEMACKIYCASADSNTTIVRMKDISDSVEAAERIFNETVDIVYGHKKD